MFPLLMVQPILSGFKVTWINNPERVEPWKGKGKVNRCQLPTVNRSQLLTFAHQPLSRVFDSTVNSCSWISSQLH